MENTLYLLILKNNQRDPSTVALESTTINIIFFRTYYLFNQFMKKKHQKNFATGNAIYLLPRTIIQIAKDNSIFLKERIGEGKSHSNWVKHWVSGIHIWCRVVIFLRLSLLDLRSNLLCFIIPSSKHLHTLKVDPFLLTLQRIKISNFTCDQAIEPAQKYFSYIHCSVVHACLL